MKVNICGIPYTIVNCKDPFDSGQVGMIDHLECKIFVTEKLKYQIRKETICHEILHGILLHIGKNELSQDEEFVQCLANAISQSFIIKITDDEDEIE